MKRRRRNRKVLWAVLRAPGSAGIREYFCAPSSEAALACCVSDGDEIQTYPCNETWHAEDCATFLASFQPERAQA